MNRQGVIQLLISGVWWALTVCCFGGTALGLLIHPSIRMDSVFALAFVAYGAVGALIAHRRPGNPIGWVFLSAGALVGLAGLADALTYDITAPALNLTPMQVLGLWVQAWFWYPLLMLVTTFTVLLYPSGLPSRRWRPVLWAAIISTAGITVAAMFAPTLSLPDGESEVDNPFLPITTAEYGKDLEQQTFFTVLSVTALLIALAGVVSVVIRYRRSRGELRAQMQWFVLAVMFLAGWMLFGAAIDSLGLADVSWLDTLQSLGLGIAMGLVPVACGIAITRHGLFEIDRVISRTLAYSVVTIVVVGTYALLITTITRLLPTQDSLVVAIATLTAAALFQPLLRLVRGVVDRRFNRAHYDALTTIDSFADALRTTVDSPRVESELRGAVSRTLEPSTYGVWLRSP